MQPSSGFSLRRLSAFLVVAIGLGSAALFYAHASTNPYDSARQATLVNDSSTGMVYNGLLAVRSDASNRCHGQFEIAGVHVKGQSLCTHGPDPAQPGVHPNQVTPTAQLTALAAQSFNTLPKDKINADLSLSQAAGSISSDLVTLGIHNPVPGSAFPCGTSGNLVQLMIVYDSHANNYTPAQITLMTRLLQSTASRMETQVRISALYSGPGSSSRAIRFATISDCSTPTVGIKNYALSADPSYSEIVSKLKGSGYDLSSRKYLVWVAHSTSWCGIGTSANDSSPGQDNANNTETGYGLIGPACWDTANELHELMHTLGAVQNNAPHTSGAFHCLDEHDEMCYADNQNSTLANQGIAANGKHIYVAANCTNSNYQYFLDCNHDDYFSTNPAILSPTSTNYLHNHWNIVNSRWLVVNQ